MDQVADGVLWPLHCGHAKLVKQCGVYVPVLECAASVGVSCIPLVVEFSSYSPATAAQRLLGAWRKQHTFVRIHLLGNSLVVLGCYIQLQAILDSEPAVTA